MGYRDVGACRLFGRGVMAWTAFLAATTLLAVGMTPVNEAAARPAEAGLAQSTTVSSVEVPSTLLASAADLPGAAQAVAFTGAAVFVQIAGETGPRVLWRESAGAEWSSHWGGTALEGELIAAESDVVHLRQGENEVLAWTRDGGGSRSVPVGTKLGRGARYIGYLTERPQVAVQTVTSDQEIQLPFQAEGDGTNGFAVVGDDVVIMRRTSVQVIDIPNYRRTAAESVCPSENWQDATLSGAGSRLVLASCGSDGAIGAADVGGVYTTFVPEGSLKRGFVTGEAFALGTSTTTGDLTVVPALSGITTVRSGTLGSATLFDLDDSATAVAFLDAGGDIRTADLSAWSSELATEVVDANPPTAFPDISGTSSPDGSVLVSRSYSVSVSATDAGTYPYEASGVATGELRFRQKLAGHSAFGGYVLAGSSISVTHPVGSTNCWSARAVDEAGNQSRWTAERCVVIDAIPPTVTTTALPARTKATERATPITFEYSAKDNGKVATYDVRYHKDKGGTQIGPWVYPRSGTGITARSFTVGTGESYRVCFSVRARDVLGNVSRWTSSRCTYVDGQAPKVTKATMSSRWLAPIRADEIRWNVRFSFGASDDQGVNAYQVEVRHAQGRARMPSTPTRYSWGEIPGTSWTFSMDPGDQVCQRVRAKDQVGNVSAWSSWKCVNAPFMTGDYYMTAADTGNFGATVTSRSAAVTKGVVGIRSVRVKVQTGPRSGAMKVYAGSEYLGTVNAYSSTSGTSWKTLTRPSGTVTVAKVRFVGTSSKYVKVRAIYFAR